MKKSNIFLPMNRLAGKKKFTTTFFYQIRMRSRKICTDPTNKGTERKQKKLHLFGQENPDEDD
jgi:hypothetical protein